MDFVAHQASRCRNDVMFLRHRSLFKNGVIGYRRVGSAETCDRRNERMEDFDDLFYGFAKTLRVRFSFAAIQKLKAHSWPGNIRELKNVVSRAKAYWASQEVGEDEIDQLIDVMPGQESTSSEAFRPSRSVITAPGPTTCYRRRARRDFHRHWACTIFRSARALSMCRKRVR